MRFKRITIENGSIYKSTRERFFKFKKLIEMEAYLMGSCVHSILVH